MEIIKGIDVSHYQGNVDWTAVESGGYFFAFVKCTGGLTFVDPKFDTNWKALAKTKLLRGGYHFFYNNDDGIKQADFFLKTLGVLDRNDLPPVLDLEQGGMADPSIAINAFQQNVLKWLEKVDCETGRKPILYTNPSFGNKYLDNECFANYPLWIAEYGVSKPKIPNAWKGATWSFWQNASSGIVNGISTKTDTDIFNGNLESLKGL